MFKGEFLSGNKSEFPGIYLGVVEDDKDPKKSGRVKIRIIGLHSEEKKDVSTDHLPWAIPAIPTFEGGTSGLGIFSVPVKGSWVAVFFIGNDHNSPIYFAAIAGFPKEASDTSKGFSDPTGKYPSIINEPDWNRNARNSGQLVKNTKDSSKTTGVTQYKSGSWEEPSSPYSAEYPNNSVIETRDNGILIELDSTTGAERFHVYHKKSGNYLEISGDGQTVFKSKDNSFEINIKDKNIYIKENKNESVGDTLDLRVENDGNEYVGGNKEVTVNSNQTENINGKLSINVVGECNITANNINIDGSGGGTVKGAVNGDCICSFTGNPHPDISTNVKISK